MNSINHSIQAFALQLETSWKSFVEFSWKVKFGTPLQEVLLSVISLLLIFTLILIGYFWKTYGKVITEKFVRPSTLKEIEELKLSVAKLKLPKEHSPRI